MELRHRLSMNEVASVVIRVATIVNYGRARQSRASVAAAKHIIMEGGKISSIRGREGDARHKMARQAADAHIGSDTSLLFGMPVYLNGPATGPFRDRLVCAVRQVAR